MKMQKEMMDSTPEHKKEVEAKERDDASMKAVEVGKQQDRAAKLEAAEKGNGWTKDETWTANLPQGMAQVKAKHEQKQKEKEEESESESEEEEEEEKSDNEEESSDEESDDEQEEKAAPAKKAAPKKAKK